MPGFAVAAWCDRLGILVAFDSSGDFTLEAAIVSLVVNVVFWATTVWSLASLIVVFRRRAGAAPADP